MEAFQRGLNLAERVRPGSSWSDTRVGEPPVGIELHEELDCACEVIESLLRWFIVIVALWFEGADTSVRESARNRTKLIFGVLALFEMV